MTFKPDTPEELINERNEVLKAIFPTISALNSAGVSDLGMAAGLLHAANSMLFGLEPERKAEIIELLIAGSDVTLSKYQKS